MQGLHLPAAEDTSLWAHMLQAPSILNMLQELQDYWQSLNLPWESASEHRSTTAWDDSGPGSLHMGDHWLEYGIARGMFISNDMGSSEDEA